MDCSGRIDLGEQLGWQDLSCFRRQAAYSKPMRSLSKTAYSFSPQMKVGFEVLGGYELCFYWLGYFQLVSTTFDHRITAFLVGLLQYKHVANDDAQATHHGDTSNVATASSSNRLVPLLHHRVATEHVQRYLSE